MLSHISLINFRNYIQARTMFGAGLNILVGPNGAGKTNMLEAISLLSTGRGLRNATLKELLPFSWHSDTQAAPHSGCGITARIEKDGDTHTLSTGLSGEAVAKLLIDSSDEPPPKRQIRIDGTDYNSQTAFSDYLSVVWLTPQMDGLLSGPAGERRRFIDRLTASHDKAHIGRLSRYEKALRQRNFLLKEKPHETVWMEGLDKEMAKTGVAIAAARNAMAQHLNTAMESMQTPFPKAPIAMQGWMEERLHKQSALEVEHGFIQHLTETRQQDVMAQSTGHGPHRSDFTTHHSEKNLAAAFCSTGEQKAMLISLIMAHAALTSPDTIILLDEIAAHLDDRRRQILLEFLVDNGHQVFATGTERKLFASEDDKARFFVTENGNISF